jgi:multicomponent Na+:H+ antiporter subunit A
LQALLVTGAGGLALLAGFLLLGQVGGSFEISDLLARREAVRAGMESSGLFVPILALILLGACTKSAQFPFHFWLPSAMEAPTPVSAYLHSATMVKAGVYLLARLTPLLGGGEAWFYALTLVGMVTMLAGGCLSLVQTDVKRILAYSTVSVLGMLVLLIGMGTDLAIAACVVFLFAHAMYKAALFLIAGALDHETGTRDVRRLSGLGTSLPVVALASFLAALSMAGAPPMMGFIGKESVYEATRHGPAPIWLTTAVVLAGTSFVAVAILVGIRPYLGRRGDLPKQPHGAPLSLWLGPALLAIGSLVVALEPAIVDRRLLMPAASAILARPVVVKLALWHGLTPTLGLSAATLAAGVVVFAMRAPLRTAAEAWRPARGPAAWYELGVLALNAVARGQTRVLQSGRLGNYLLVVLLSFVGLTGWALIDRFGIVIPADWSDVRIHEAGLMLLIVAGAVATVRGRSRLAAITSLGVVGYGVAMVFALFSAPDLAMTQFLVETLTLVLFVLVFYHVPEPAPLSGFASRLRDAFCAALVGGLMTLLVFAAIELQLAPSISAYYLEQSVPAAHGRNVVNVILVDFRALDTLGEITVLAAAGIGVYALLKLRLDKPTDAPDAAAVDGPDGAPRGGAVETLVANEGSR